MCRIAYHLFDILIIGLQPLNALARGVGILDRGANIILSTSLILWAGTAFDLLAAAIRHGSAVFVLCLASGRHAAADAIAFAAFLIGTASTTIDRTATAIFGTAA